MKTVRFGIIGFGNAGQLHGRALLHGKVPGTTLAAVVEREETLARLAEPLPRDVRTFATIEELLAVNICDAVLIATPHTVHATQTQQALRAGLHVLCEKPAGVSASEARQMARTAEECGRLYALNFNRRTMGVYQRLRDAVRSGTLGELRRIQWTSTKWLRLQSYYDSSVWRGTWRGEGGGILLNQLPHALDLWQWICGMPVRLRAFCHFGKHHDIEVEDDVTAYAEYENGATAVFIANTGEAPGTERIEIVGDGGTAVLEHETELRITTLDSPVRRFIRETPAGFDAPAAKTQTLRDLDAGDLLAGITRNFTDAIRHGLPLLSPGADGTNSLQLANAMLLSTWNNDWVPLPFDESAYDRELYRRQTGSRLRQPEQTCVMHLEDSFALGR